MFKIEGHILNKAVAFVSGIVSKTQVVSPVLQNIKLTFDSSGLKLETTNTDIFCLQTIDASLIQSKSTPFTTTVPAIKLNEILKKTSQESLSCKFLKTKDKEVFVVKGSKSKFLLDCIPASSYPSPRNLEYLTSFSIKASTFLSAIKRVEFSVCTDEARFYINGILFDLAGKNSLDAKSLNIVSTDSHRLSIQSLDFESQGDIQQIILPRRSIQKVVDILTMAKEDDIFIEINKTKIKFSFGGCSVVSNLIEGEFPNYQRVVPQNSSFEVTVYKSELQKAINSVSAIFSGSAYNIVKLNFLNNNLEIEANRNVKNLGSDIGMAKYNMQCESNFNELFSVSYNYSYLNDCLNAIESEKCKILFTESTKPCLILPVYETKVASESGSKTDVKEKQPSDYKFIIMPIRA
jgi:DNA polymerase-3 subunit beta